MERPVCNQSTVGPVMCAVSPLGTDRKFDIVNIDIIVITKCFLHGHHNNDITTMASSALQSSRFQKFLNFSLEKHLFHGRIVKLNR